MKKILIFFLGGELLISYTYSQNVDHLGGGRFSKNIEYNLLWLEAGYNFNSKGEVEKLFFGDFNAPVEFFYAPSFEGASGFRIVRDTLEKSYTLEIKFVSNFKEADEESSKKYPLAGISADQMLSISKVVSDSIRDLNRNNMIKAHEKRNQLFKIESRSFPISDLFAEKLYKAMVSVIDNFKARGVPPFISDGYSVTFRNVVEDEVWSLKIHMPTGSALKLSDFCRKVIEETLATGNPDESSYIKLLDVF